MKHRAFTLVELLVIIGVLAVLIVLFLPPGFGRPNQNARKSSCQNNLKRIALAVKQYQNDFDEYYPLIFGATASNTTSPYGWTDVLQPYAKDAQVFQCPSDASPAGSSPSQSGYTDYWFNANFTERLKLQGKTIYKSIEAHGVGYYPHVIMIGDGGDPNGNSGHNATYNQCGDGSSLNGPNQVCGLAKSLTSNYPAAQIHLDGANFAFPDGHVKWFRANNSTHSTQIVSNRATFSNLGSNYTFSRLVDK